MQQVDMTFRRARTMRQLDHFYLSVGILHELSMDLFPDRQTKAYRESVLILDQQSDIPAPASLPANWPVAIIRAYEEVHVQKEVLIRYHPEAVGINQDSTGYSEDTAMDQLGLRAYCQHLAKSRKGLSLKGGFLLMAESEQTSLVPMLGEPEEFTGISYMLDQLPKGMLDAYYRRQVTEDYEKAAISESLHESVENMAGRAGRFHNWELANALVATACMSWMQFQKVDLNAPQKARGDTPEFAEIARDAMDGERMTPELVQEPAANTLIDKPAGVEVTITTPDLQDVITLPVGSELAGDYGRGQTPFVHTAEDMGGTLDRLNQVGLEPTPEQAAVQDAFEQLSPTEQAAKALGVAPGELEELSKVKDDAIAAGVIKVTDVALNMYEKLGAHIKRSNGIVLGTSSVSRESLAGIIAYLRNMIEAPFAMTYAGLEKLVLATETDFNELTYAVPALASADPKDVAEAFQLALIYMIDGSNDMIYALAPLRYDEQDNSRFTPFLEPVGDLTDEAVDEILATAHMDATRVSLFKQAQAEE